MMRTAIFCFVFSISCSLFARESQTSCARLKNISGDSCESLLVSFDLSACGTQESETETLKVKCNGSKAEITQGMIKAKLKLEKKGWSGATWRLVGSIHGANPATEVKGSPSSVERQIQPASGPAPVEKKESVTWKFSGYLDARITNVENHDSQSSFSGKSESGFGIEDGALYLNVEKEKYSLVVDIPFRRFKDADDNSGTGPYSNNQKILIGGDKAQLFGKVKLHKNLILNLGQFDTPYGVELNDSKDRFFNKTGLVYDATLPVTHTGVLIEVPLDIFTLKFLAANSNNKGSLGDSTAGDNEYEYGFTFGGSQEKWRFQLGAMARPINKADGSAKGNRSLYDLTTGVTLGSWNADMEYSIVHDENKNTLTSGDSSDKEDDGTGVLLLLSYQLHPEWSAGVRFEHLENDPGASSTEKSDSSGLAVHYKPHSDYEVRGEYINLHYKMVDGTKWEQNRFNLGILFFF